MPIQFTVNHGQGYYVAKYIGLISDDEMLESWEKFFYSDKWYIGLCNLSDLSQANTDLVTGEGVIKLAKLIHRVYREHNGGDTKAAILVHDKLLYGMARMFTSWMGESPIKLRIFHDRGEAMAWLLSENLHRHEQAGQYTISATKTVPVF